MMFLNREETLAKLENFECLLVDVRNPAQYKHRHYPGAINAREDHEILALPKDPLIIVYCTCTHDGLAIKRAKLLEANGYPNTAVVRGGMYELFGEPEPVAEEIAKRFLPRPPVDKNAEKYAHLAPAFEEYMKRFR